MTFMPQFYKDENLGVIYADIAGLEDSGGPMFEIINIFTCKILFEKAKDVKIIVPISFRQFNI